MADLQTKSFSTLVSDAATAIQGASSALVDFTVGSILRAVMEAMAAVVLWLQGLILTLLATTRAATSSGAALDSWMADFGIFRLVATLATGIVTFARFTPSSQALIPVGALVQTADGSEQFAVVADTTNANFSPGSNGYIVPAGTASIDVPVQAVTGGAASNVAAGGISVLAQAIGGIDTVTNTAPFDNGADAETDAALRARFLLFLSSLSKATKAANGYAITSLKLNLDYQLVENEDYNGNTDLGYFYDVIDDGTGAPSGTILAQAGNAIDAVRPLCSSFGVFAPTVLTANVTMQITTAAGYIHSAVAAIVATAIQNYIAGLALGQSLSWSRLFQVAFDASPGVASVVTCTLNGLEADLTAISRNKISPGSISVS